MSLLGICSLLPWQLQGGNPILRPGSADVVADALTTRATNKYYSPTAGPLHPLPQDLALARDLQDRMSMGRAYCNLGLAHAAIGNLENALECQKYFLGKINPI